MDGRVAPPCGVVSLCRQSSALRSDLRQHERVEFLNDMQPPQTSLAYRDMPDHLVGRSGLRRHAGIFHLWALGVGAVISGDFFGWNFGLLSGGFGGLLAALAIMTLWYLCLCLSLAEMSPAMPHAGGAYSFARTALGPWCGYITGLAENIEYIFTPAVIVVGAGG